MKLVGKCSRVLVGLTIALTLTAHAEDVPGTSTGKRNHEFVLKADRKFIGAAVEVLQANGRHVLQEKLERKRMTVDFSLVQAGEYIIRLKKDHEILEFRYVKI
jgi:hypothetical protein